MATFAFSNCLGELLQILSCAAPQNTSFETASVNQNIGKSNSVFVPPGEPGQRKCLLTP